MAWPTRERTSSQFLGQGGSCTPDPGRRCQGGAGVLHVREGSGWLATEVKSSRYRVCPNEQQGTISKAGSGEEQKRGLGVAAELL